MKICTLIGAIQVFNQFAQTKISAKLAYKIMRFCKDSETEEIFFNTKRQEIIDTYSIKDDNGNIVITDNGMIKIIPDKTDEANATLQELNNVEIEPPNVRFTLEELEELKMSVADMYAINEFITHQND